jgi:hypothetical protein
MPKAEKQRELSLLVAVKSIEAPAAFLRFDRQGRYRPRVNQGRDAGFNEPIGASMRDARKPYDV